MVENTLNISDDDYKGIIAKLNGKYAEMLIKKSYENKGKTFKVIPCKNWQYEKPRADLTEGFKTCAALQEAGKRELLVGLLKKKGVPDFLVINQNTFFFVEVKSRGSNLSEYQRKFIKSIQERHDIPCYLGYVFGLVEPDIPKEFDIIRIDADFEEKLLKAKAKHQK